MEQAWEAFIEMARAQADELGLDLVAAGQDVAEYAAARAAHLATLIGQPGFSMAMRAEADNVILKAGILAVDQGDAADRRIKDTISGALGMAAAVLLA